MTELERIKKRIKTLRKELDSLQDKEYDIGAERAREEAPKLIGKCFRNKMFDGELCYIKVIDVCEDSPYEVKILTVRHTDRMSIYENFEDVDTLKTYRKIKNSTFEKHLKITLNSILEHSDTLVCVNAGMYQRCV